MVADNILCVSVERRYADIAIRRLKSRGLVNTEYRVSRLDGIILIPVVKFTGDLHDILEGVPFVITECSPPARRLEPAVRVPSYDLIGGVAIVRSNVLGFMEESELVEALRSVHPGLKAIYVKEETVDEYRVPVLRLLWGEPVSEVVAKEYGLLFKVSLGRVYYNPRLAEEHHRIAVASRDGELIVDLFTGIGGFPVHIASLRRSLIIANDLNPEAYRLLCWNIEANARRLKGTIIPLNTDARRIVEYVRIEGKADRVIANLPKSSLEFLGVYDAVLKPGGVLHLYHLTYDPDTTRVELESRLPGWRIQESRLVLEYAPRAGVYRFDLVKP
ncbi:MAG: methyltransferase [Desulfurococcus sp.]|nr:methyltransferase [Desulfurococcus sp.]